MNPLLALELEVLGEGREWTRRRLEKRLQTEADSIGAVCPETGLVLKDVRRRPITLLSCVGDVTVQAAYGFSSKTGRWLSPAREKWGLAPYQRVSPELQQRVDYSATQTGSYQKAAAMATRWGSPVSDDLIRDQVQRVGERACKAPVPLAATPSQQEPPFSLVIMMDGWFVRERGAEWAAPKEQTTTERIAWREVKTAVVFRLEHLAQSDSGRGLILEKKVVACPPGTDPLEFGAAVQAQATACGLARARETFVVMDGAVWLWRVAKDRFGQATALLDFYHASEHLWELARELHPQNPDQARSFVEPLLHQLRHGGEDRVIARLEELIPISPHGDSNPSLQTKVEYFLNHRDHLGYQKATARGAPAGSGAIESQCSQLQNRFKRTGQFWSPSGLANLLALDLAVRNEAFDCLWN